jgi:Holliday junction resolvase RusA-like endonuclease
MVIRNVVVAKGKFAPDVPIRMEATFYRLRPKHLPKRVQFPISRPDIDNCYRLVSDALEKYVYGNDSQITCVLMKKRFGDPPRIELLLEEDEV